MKANGYRKCEMYSFRFGKYSGKLLEIIGRKNACVLGKLLDSGKYFVCDCADFRGAYIDCIGGVELDSLFDAKLCYKAYTSPTAKKTVREQTESNAVSRTDEAVYEKNSVQRKKHR